MSSNKLPKFLRRKKRQRPEPQIVSGMDKEDRMKKDKMDKFGEEDKGDEFELQEVIDGDVAVVSVSEQAEEVKCFLDLPPIVMPKPF